MRVCHSLSVGAGESASLKGRFAISGDAEVEPAVLDGLKADLGGTDASCVIPSLDAKTVRGFVQNARQSLQNYCQHDPTFPTGWPVRGDVIFPDDAPRGAGPRPCYIAELPGNDFPRQTIEVYLGEDQKTACASMTSEYNDAQLGHVTHQIDGTFSPEGRLQISGKQLSWA